jgi:hypothetical protein
MVVFVPITFTTQVTPSLASLVIASTGITALPFSFDAADVAPISGTFTSATSNITQIEIDITPINATQCNVTTTIPPSAMSITGAPGGFPTGFSPGLTNFPLGTVTLDADRTIDFTFIADGTGGGSPPNINAPGIEIFVGGIEATTPVTSFPAERIITIDPFCVHPDSLVHTTEGLIKISDLKQHTKLIGINGEIIDLIANAKFVPTTTFVEISAGALSKNIPSESLLITSGHPIYFSREIIAQNLINGDTIKKINLEMPTNVYSLCTAIRTYVLINNVPVCTWCYDDLLKKKTNSEGKCACVFQ